jgi:RNA polymerase sigma-70 factor, ECF subfamily
MNATTLAAASHQVVATADSVPPPPASATRLVQRSFADAVVKLLPELRAKALRLAGTASFADDLVQDTFERAVRFQAQYEQGTNLRAWLSQILYSIFVTRYRSQTRERSAMRRLGVDPSAWTLCDRFASVESGLSLSASLNSVLDTVPQAFREAVLKVDIDELSYQDAAQALHVPVGTVMSRLHRGRKLLREKLAGQELAHAA